MDIENYISLRAKRGYSGLFFASGSFGIIDGDVEYEKTEEGAKTVYTYQNEKIKYTAEFEKAGEVFVRRDSILNISGEKIRISDLVSRFVLPCSDYDVYTQYNAWQRENRGEWQRLVTQIRAEALGMRGCDGATPIMAFHDRYNKQNYVFHLVPSAAWQMTAKKFPLNDTEIIVFEAGFSNTGLNLSVESYEKIELPEVIFFPAKSELDLDGYKLHDYFNKTYPRRKTPIFYNNWLYSYDDVNIDDLIEEARVAGEMGFEGFMVDAGWFGDAGCGSWTTKVGDWVENTESGPSGRLVELAERVRELGMVFGLWFEPERASVTSRAPKEHPEYYILSGMKYLLDFANPDAVDYMVDTISENIEKYGIGWVKFDFNVSVPIDTTGAGYYRYLAGQRSFVEKLRAKYPDLYITNCAAGGFRTDLYQAKFCDSFWFSDNQGLLFGLDIIKGALKRMPSSCIERWNAQQYATGFHRNGKKERGGVLFNANDGTWSSVLSLDPSFAEGFVVGGPIGFSSDLVSLPDEYKERWKGVIAQYKTDREFYKNATARIIVDTEPITVLQYADSELSNSVLQVFTNRTTVKELRVFPAAMRGVKYAFGDATLLGEDILENGIKITGILPYSSKTVTLKRI